MFSRYLRVSPCHSSPMPRKRRSPAVRGLCSSCPLTPRCSNLTTCHKNHSIRDPPAPEHRQGVIELVIGGLSGTEKYQPSSVGVLNALYLPLICNPAMSSPGCPFVCRDFDVCVNAEVARLLTAEQPPEAVKYDRLGERDGSPVRQLGRNLGGHSRISSRAAVIASEKTRRVELKCAQASGRGQTKCGRSE